MFFNPQWFYPRRRAWIGSKPLAYTLTADQGTYNLIGSDALADHEVTADQGSFTITGQDASLYRGYVFPVASGTFALTGQAATLTATGATALVADTGIYSITGFDAALFYAPVVADSQQLVRVRNLSWEEICRRSWGKEWTKRETAYEFSGGRKFEDAIEGGPYGEID
jgi:hypothetical protein